MTDLHRIEPGDEYFMRDTSDDSLLVLSGTRSRYYLYYQWERDGLTYRIGARGEKRPVILAQGGKRVKVGTFPFAEVRPEPVEGKYASLNLLDRVVVRCR